MKKLLLISLLIPLLALAFPVNADSMQGYFHDHTCYMYAGPWIHYEVEEDGNIIDWWAGPESCISSLDLTSYQQWVDHNPGWAVFFCTQPVDLKGYISLGTDFNLDLPPAVVNTLEHKYDILIEAYTVNGTIWELYVEEGDPTGIDRWKPLQPEHDGTLVININGFSPVTFAKDKPRCNNKPAPFKKPYTPFRHWGWFKPKHIQPFGPKWGR